MMRTSRRAMLGAMASLPLVNIARAAEAWPSRPIRFVVPYPPGGPTDILARIVTERLAGVLGQPIIVENRGGASGVIGSAEVARSPADGTTFLANASIHVIIPHINKEVPFDTLAAFAPVTTIARVPLMLVVNPDLPVRDVPGLIAWLKQQKGSASYASSGIGAAPHLAGELFKQMTGTEMVHVPYRGSGPALQDLLAGNVQLMFDSMPSSAGAVRQGQLRALAVTTESRVQAFPELPTVAEAGVPGYEIATWYGVWAPAGTPAPIVATMQEAVAEAVAQPETRELLAAMGAQPVADSPEAFADFTRAEYARWGKLVRDAHIEAN